MGLLDFNLISVFALIVSIISLIIHYRLIKRTIGESIIHELKDIPPYKSEGNLSTIVVKNMGNANARIHSTCILFDWDDDLQIQLDYECDEDEPYILSQNGEKSFHKNLPSPPTKGEHFIRVCTCTHDSNEPYSNRFRTFF